MKPTANKISTKLSKIKTSLSLQQAEKVVQGVKSYKKWGDRYESDSKDLKSQLLRIKKQLKTGIGEIQEDQKILTKAMFELGGMIKTIGKDIPSAVAGIENRRDEIKDAYNDLDTQLSKWNRLNVEIGNIN